MPRAGHSYTGQQDIRARYTTGSERRSYQSSQTAFVLGGLLQHGKSSPSHSWVAAIYLSHQHLDAPLFRANVIRGCDTFAGHGVPRISELTVCRASAPQCSSDSVKRKQTELAGEHSAGVGREIGLHVASLAWSWRYAKSKSVSSHKAASRGEERIPGALRHPRLEQIPRREFV